VEDVRPFLGPARVCVVPLRIGGGTRITIALRIGKFCRSSRRFFYME
jgi:hypothetical protein